MSKFSAYLRSTRALRRAPAAALLLVLAACGDDDNGPSEDTGIDVLDSGGDTTSDAGDVGLDATDVGTDAPLDTTDVAETSPDVADTTPDADTGADTETDAVTALIDDVSVVTSPSNALAAYVDVETVDGADVTVTLLDGETVVSTATSLAGASHSLFVWGMRPGDTYDIRVEASLDEGTDTATESHTAGSLPEDFPPLRVDASTPESMAPGLTLFSVFRWTPQVDAGWAYTVMLDASGTPVWYARVDGNAAETRVMPNGNIGVIINDDEYIELDVDGSEVLSIHADDLGVDTIHHEWFTMPSGNVVFLGTELQEIDGYDDGDGGTVAHDVVADVITEITPDGTIVHAHSLFDILDPLEPNPSFNSPFWNTHYADDAPDGTKDWTHANAVVYDPDEDYFIVSVRHMDAVIAMDRTTGELIWRFGPGGDFELTNGEFSLHTHAPQIQEDGAILLFDNGNFRDSETPYSRAVEYTLDWSSENPDDWTATQTWEHTDDYFAPFVGDADRTSTGSVLVCAGGIVADPTLGVGVPDNHKSARIYEVLEDGTIVFDLTIDDDAETDPIGYTVYRTERIEWAEIGGVDE